jgi:hypothetical protein
VRRKGQYSVTQHLRRYTELTNDESPAAGSGHERGHEGLQRRPSGDDGERLSRLLLREISEFLLGAANESGRVGGEERAPSFLGQSGQVLAEGLVGREAVELFLDASSNVELNLESDAALAGFLCRTEQLGEGPYGLLCVVGGRCQRMVQLCETRDVNAPTDCTIQTSLTCEQRE